METRNSNPLHYVTEAYRRQLDLELWATRGRTTWGVKKPARRRRLFALVGRPA